MILAERLANQFEQRICRVCVHETATGGCTLTRDRECPIFQWAEQLAEVAAGVGRSEARAVRLGCDSRKSAQIRRGNRT